MDLKRVLTTVLQLSYDLKKVFFCGKRVAILDGTWLRFWSIETETEIWKKQIFYASYAPYISVGDLFGVPTLVQADIDSLAMRHKANPLQLNKHVKH